MTENQEITKEIKPLRAILIGDDDDLHSYGPVLRRLSVGLLDDVADLSILSLGDSNLLKFVPSPPVRLIIEHKEPYQVKAVVNERDRHITISRPSLNILEYIWPHRRINRIAETLQAYKPTLLHALSGKHAKFVRRLSKHLNIPYVISVLACNNKNLAVSQRRCGQILPCFSSLTRQIRQARPNIANRVHHLTIGTHVNENPCCFNHDDKLPHLFCSTRLEHKYGLSTLLYAMAKLTENEHKFHLTISGHGPAESELRKLSSTLKLNNIVHFIEPLEDIIADNDAYKLFLQTVDIFIQPWTSQVWRPELTEAMAVGNAVVVAQGTDNDLTQNNKAALTFNPNDSNSLAGQLELLLTDHDHARQLARQCQDHVRKHFLASQMISCLTKAYRQAVDMEI
ncbi:MAG: glycosyltransferase family 4 protein [Phycisphaerae bacterium]|nr:glycosyltransferase family 4 protein [Phycisphaerae bacterium]